MLPAYIIEELRRREHAREEQESRPALELPIPLCPSPKTDEAPQSDRGVVIIDVMG